MTQTPQFPLVAALVAIAAGLVAVALLGPLTGGPVEYHVSETLRNQTIGLDATSLFVVAPLAVAAAVLARRGHVAGPALALGVGAYTGYMFVQYIVGPEYLARPGDNELLFPLYLCLFALGWGSAVLAWQAITPESNPDTRRRDRIVGRLALPLLAFLAFSRYGPALADAMSSAPIRMARVEILLILFMLPSESLSLKNTAIPRNSFVVHQPILSDDNRRSPVIVGFATARSLFSDSSLKSSIGTAEIT